MNLPQQLIASPKHLSNFFSLFGSLASVVATEDGVVLVSFVRHCDSVTAKSVIDRRPPITAVWLCEEVCREMLNASTGLYECRIENMFCRVEEEALSQNWQEEILSELGEETVQWQPRSISLEEDEGCASLIFAVKAHALACLQLMNGRKFNGRILEARFATI